LNFRKEFQKVQDLRYVIAFQILQSEHFWKSYETRNIAKDCVFDTLLSSVLFFFSLFFFSWFPRTARKNVKRTLLKTPFFAKRCDFFLFFLFVTNLFSKKKAEGERDLAAARELSLRETGKVDERRWCRTQLLAARRALLRAFASAQPSNAGIFVSMHDSDAYVHTYIHTYVHTYIHTYTHTYTHAYIHTCIHTCIHTYIHMHTYVHIHKYVHTHLNDCT